MDITKIAIEGSIDHLEKLAFCKGMFVGVLICAAAFLIIKFVKRGN